ncbi:MAG: hypothetical protein DHS80DRAFT_32443 [Piptocephalis tieghemiana]|nr:MAG: hypothetical protein DHS80DRAFT_32443 [Piptocephalis tieghemiana]
MHFLNQRITSILALLALMSSQAMSLPFFDPSGENLPDPKDLGLNGPVPASPAPPEARAPTALEKTISAVKETPVVVKSTASSIRDAIPPIFKASSSIDLPSNAKGNDSAAISDAEIDALFVDEEGPGGKGSTTDLDSSGLDAPVSGSEISSVEGLSEEDIILPLNVKGDPSDPDDTDEESHGPGKNNGFQVDIPSSDESSEEGRDELTPKSPSQGPTDKPPVNSAISRDYSSNLDSKAIAPSQEKGPLPSTVGEQNVRQVPLKADAPQGHEDKM